MTFTRSCSSIQGDMVALLQVLILFDLDTSPPPMPPPVSGLSVGRCHLSQAAVPPAPPAPPGLHHTRLTRRCTEYLSKSKVQQGVQAPQGMCICRLHGGPAASVGPEPWHLHALLATRCQYIPNNTVSGHQWPARNSLHEHVIVCQWQQPTQACLHWPVHMLMNPTSLWCFIYTMITSCHAAGCHITCHHQSNSITVSALSHISVCFCLHH